MSAIIERTVPVDPAVRDLAAGMLADAGRLASICRAWTTPEKVASILPLATAINAQSRQLIELAGQRDHISEGSGDD